MRRDGMPKKFVGGRSLLRGASVGAVVGSGAVTGTDDTGTGTKEGPSMTDRPLVDSVTRCTEDLL